MKIGCDPLRCCCLFVLSCSRPPWPAPPVKMFAPPFSILLVLPLCYFVFYFLRIVSAFYCFIALLSFKLSLLDVHFVWKSFSCECSVFLWGGWCWLWSTSSFYGMADCMDWFPPSPHTHKLKSAVHDFFLVCPLPLIMINVFLIKLYTSKDSSFICRRPNYIQGHPISIPLGMQKGKKGKSTN